MSTRTAGPFSDVYPSHAVTIDGQDLKLSNGWFEDSWTYNCQTGGSVSVLWQLYRPLLGNTVEITTGVHPHPVIFAAWL